jgi:hypothetical protein
MDLLEQCNPYVAGARRRSTVESPREIDEQIPNQLVVAVFAAILL